MMLNEFLERAEPIGQLLHAIGTNGRLVGARSSYSKINGTTGDTGDTDVSSRLVPPRFSRR